MMAKIVQGSCFKGVVNYVLDKKEARLLATKWVRNIDKESIIHSFETQARLGDIAKPVAHISLDFPAQDKEKLTDRMMIEIADEYIQKMGYGNTQVLMVRHRDRDHPHLHLVLNRIDNDGKRIPDRNERLCSTKVCRELTLKHGLYMATGKENVKRHRLREPDATKYRIYDALVKHVPKSKSWAELQSRLRAEGIGIGFKTKGSTSQVEGVRFTMNNLSFNGSKVDRQFSYSKIDYTLRQNDKAEQLRQQPAQVAATEHRYATNLLSLIGGDAFFNQSPDYDPDEAELEYEQRLRKKKNRGRSM